MNRNGFVVLSLQSIFIASVACGFCRADTVFLKDGSEVEGTVTQENGAQVVVQLASGASRTLRRSDVDSIVKSRHTQTAGAQPPPAAVQQVPETIKPASAASAPNSVIDNLRKLAEGGDAASQLELGKRYGAGQDVAPDAAEGKKWLQRAAEHSAEYKYLVGFAYYMGDGVEQDMQHGQTLIQAAADGGHANAERFIGVEYLNQPNIAKANEWLKKSAEHGDAFGQYLLAQNYLKGNGLEKNADEALKWMKQSAAKGFPQAVVELNKMMSPNASH